MNRLWWAAVIAFVLSAGAFLEIALVESERNWAPVRVPLPAPGHAAEHHFWIATPGEFELEIEAPAREGDSGLPCNLDLQIANRSGIVEKQWIGELAKGGSIDAVHRELWVATVESTELSAGAYDFRLLNRGGDPFGGRATVRFTRFRQPTEAYVRRLFMFTIAVLLLLAAIVFAMFAHSLRTHRQGTST